MLHRIIPAAALHPYPRFPPQSGSRQGIWNEPQPEPKSQYSKKIQPASKQADNLHRFAVIVGGGLDPRAFCGGVDDLPVSNVHGHMVDPAAAAVEQQVAWLHLILGYLPSIGRLPLGEWGRLMDADLESTYLVNPEQSAPVFGSVPPYT